MMKLRHREVKSLSPLLVVAVSELNSVRAAPDSSPICHAASPVLDFAPPPPPPVLGFVPLRMVLFGFLIVVDVVFAYTFMYV